MAQGAGCEVQGPGCEERQLIIEFKIMDFERIDIKGKRKEERLAAERLKRPVGRQ